MADTLSRRGASGSRQRQYVSTVNEAERNFSSSIDIQFSKPYSWSMTFERLLCHFWEIYLPRGQYFPLMHPTQLQLGGSISVLQEMPPSDLLRCAMLSVVFTNLARNNPTHSDLRQQGLMLHGLALNNMAEALAAPNRYKTLELLAATRLLSFLQVQFHPLLDAMGQFWLMKS